MRAGLVHNEEGERAPNRYKSSAKAMEDLMASDLGRAEPL